MPPDPPETTSDFAERGDGVQLPDIVSNFQDLSAVLSLLAADTVEQKQSDPNSLLWERMSTAWCLFGIIGLLRAYLKIFVGLMRAEIAGVQLLGAGGLTRRYTKGGRSSWNNARAMWQDPNSFPLGFVVASADTPWSQPHVTIIGYSRCPLHRGILRLLRERLMPFVWATVTVAIATVPVLIILERPFETISRLETVTVSLAMGVGLFAGGITPTLLEYLNPYGATNLARFADPLPPKPLQPFVEAAKTPSVQETGSTTQTVTSDPVDSGTALDSATHCDCAASPGDSIIAGRTRSFTIWSPNHFGLAPEISTEKPSRRLGDKMRRVSATSVKKD